MLTKLFGPRLWIVLVIVALLAAACGGDDDAADAPAEPETTVEGDTDQPPADEPEPEGGDGAEGDDSGGATEEPEPEEPAEGEVLTDSFRGVTADTITLGHTSIDFDTLNENFGLDLAFQDFRPAYDAVAAWYNERGGVLGRQIELIHSLFLPVGATTAEESCLELTEDNEVFAVLAGFAGPGAESVNECIANLHETVLVGAPPTAAQAEAAGGLWVGWDMGLDRRNQAFVNLLDRGGIAAELGSVMVVGANPDESALVAEFAEALRGVGVDVGVETWITTSGDIPATNAEVAILVERARADDLSTVVLIGEGEIRNIAFFETAPDLTYLVPNGDRITDWQSIPPEGLQAGTRVLSSNRNVLKGQDPDLDECIAVVETALGVEVKPPQELAEGEPNHWSGTLNACRFIGTFVQIAEAAGPDLTNATWVAALDNVPDLKVPGFQFVSLSSTKLDARDELVLVEFDLATLTFVELTDPIDVG